MDTKGFSINQIVRAKVGTFVILGFRTIGGADCAQVKEVHPVTFDHARVGELALPLSSLREV